MKKMMKVVIASLLAVIMLVGCGNKASNKAEGTTGNDAESTSSTEKSGGGAS